MRAFNALRSLLLVIRLTALSSRTGIPFERLVEAHVQAERAYTQALAYHLSLAQALTQAQAEVDGFLSDRASDVN